VYDAHIGRLGDGPAVRSPQETSARLTVAHLCNRFLTAKLRHLEAGEIASRTYREYRGTTDDSFRHLARPSWLMIWHPMISRHYVRMSRRCGGRFDSATKCNGFAPSSSTGMNPG